MTTFINRNNMKMFNNMQCMPNRLETERKERKGFP